MSQMRRLAWSGATCLLMSAALVAAAQKPDAKDKDSKDAEGRRPKLSLKAAPVISMSPSRVVLTAELIGGANDFEEFYCPTVEWDWGDGTQSEASSDCEPYEAGKSEIKRRYTVSHVFRAGHVQGEPAAQTARQGYQQCNGEYSGASGYPRQRRVLTGGRVASERSSSHKRTPRRPRHLAAAIFPNQMRRFDRPRLARDWPSRFPCLSENG